MTTRASKQPLTPGPYCERFAALLPLLSANELEPEEASVVRAHLSDCPWCQRQLREYTTVERSLRQHLAALEAPFPALSAQEVITMAEHTSPTQSAPAPSAPIKPALRPRHVSRFFTWVGPLAAVLLIVLLTTSIFSLRGHPPTSNQGTPALYISTLHDIVALRQSDGKLLWRTAVSGSLTSSPISDQGVVYATAFHNDGAFLVALRASDGKILWQTTPDDSIHPVITAANGLLYMVTSVYHCCPSDPLEPQALVAFRGSDGVMLWRYRTSDQITSAPIVAGSTIYVGAGSTLVALNAQDGRLVWQKKLNLAPVGMAADGATIIASAPSNEWLTTDGDNLYIYTDTPHQQTPGSTMINDTFAQVFWLRASDGALIMQDDLGAHIQDSFLPLIFVNNRLYLVAAQVDPQADHTTMLIKVMLLLIRDDQQPSTPVASGSGAFPEIRALAPPMYADGTLYYYSSSESLDALRLSDHRLLWSHSFAPLPEALPLGASNGAIFVDTHVSLWALSVSDGRVLWQHAKDSLK